MLARYSAVWVLKSESFFPPFLQNVFCKMESFFLFSKKKISSFALNSLFSQQPTWKAKGEGKILVRESESECRIAWNGFLDCVRWVGGCKWGGTGGSSTFEKKSSFYIFGKISVLSRMSVTVFVLLMWRSCMALISS